MGPLLFCFISLLAFTAHAKVFPRAATTAIASPAGGCTVSYTTTQLLTITTQSPGISCKSNTVAYYALPSFTVTSSVKTCLVAVTSTITSYDDSGLCWTSAVALTKSTWTGGSSSVCTLATRIRYHTVTVAAPNAAIVQSVVVAEPPLIRAGENCLSTTTYGSTVTVVKQSATALDTSTSTPYTSPTTTRSSPANNNPSSLAVIATSLRSLSSSVQSAASSTEAISQSRSTVTSVTLPTAAGSVTSSSRTSSISVAATTNAAVPQGRFSDLDIIVLVAPCLAWLL